jgi:hypothetical protein
VANASEVDPSTLVKPVWGVQWQVSRYYEVLIGPKIDPFCFSVIPSNSSEGALCYRADYGAQYADATFNGGEGALRIDLNAKSIVGNVSSTVLHEGPNFWIVNTFPWYTLGTQQCVCTEVYQGGDKSTTAMYPVQYNWTEQLVFVAREEVGVEYTGTTQVTTTPNRKQQHHACFSIVTLMKLYHVFYARFFPCVVLLYYFVSLSGPRPLGVRPSPRVERPANWRHHSHVPALQRTSSIPSRNCGEQHAGPRVVS